MMRALLLITAVAGCGRIAFDPLGDGGSTGPIAPLQCGPWGAPTRLDALATPDRDWDPTIDPTGTVLFFSSDVLNPGSKSQLYRADKVGASFGPPARATALSPTSSDNDVGPQYDRTGTKLYFSSDRNGSTGVQLYVADLAATSGVPELVPELAGTSISAVAFSPDGLEMYYGDDLTVVSIGHVHRATRATTSSPWEPQGIEAQLDVGTKTCGWPTIAPDGLTMIFEGDDATSMSELYEAHRAATTDHFGTPTLIPYFTGMVQEGDPEFSRDGRTLFFAGEAAGSTTLFDIYTVTRTCN